jgi:hypothetical protein
MRTKQQELPPQWEKYRNLIDETSALEHDIIGIMYEALCRKDGDGHPNPTEQSRISEMKQNLKAKVKELKELQKEVSSFLRDFRQKEIA